MNTEPTVSREEALKIQAEAEAAFEVSVQQAQERLGLALDPNLVPMCKQMFVAGYLISAHKNLVLRFNHPMQGN